ncbi:hypothetical protein Tco_1357443, partial [Tanacetum coccineum]
MYPRSLLEYKRMVERFHESYAVRTMEIEAGYSFLAAPAVAGCNSSTATTKRSKRSTEVAVTVSGETLREVGDMLLKVDQVMPRFRLIDWVYYCRVARRHVFGMNIFES